MKSVITKSRLKNFLTMTATFACLSAPAFAKQQYAVPAEQDAYTACGRPVQLVDALRNEPEAQEFLRLLAATEKAGYHLRVLESGFLCHVVIVPNNAALKNIEVTDQNRDALAILLRSHFIGATKLEDSDFSQAGTSLRSPSGEILKLARSESGTMTVNGIPVTSGQLNAPGHTILVVSDVLPEIPEEISSAIETFIPAEVFGPGVYRDVLKNVTGKPYMYFNEIASLCGFEDRLKAGNVTVLLPREITQINTPILRDLFASDKDFVCRAFTSNVIEGRYNAKDLRELGKTGTGTIKSIDGRVFPVSYFSWVQEFAQIGIDKVQVWGPSVDDSLLEINGERQTASYTITLAHDLISLD